MRNTKKAISILLTLLMVVGMMSTFAFADSNPTLTINKVNDNDTGNRIYYAYQIFDGDLSQDKDTLSNIQWGTGVDKSKLIKEDNVYKFAFPNNSDKNEAYEVAKLITNANIKDFAKKIASVKSDNKTQLNFENGAYKASLDPGYYLIVEVAGKTADGKDDTESVLSNYIVEMTKNQNVDPKSATTVPDIVKTTTSVSASVGDKIPYVLQATLPSDFTSYETYKLVFTDTLSKGLTFNKDSVKIYVAKSENNKYIKDETKDITSYFTISDASAVEGEKTQFKITGTDITGVPNLTNGSVIIVEYNATLNKDAVNETTTVIGENKVTNEVSITYSRDPKNPELEGTKKPNTPPETKTFNLRFTKVNEEWNPLNGAEFTLYKESVSDANKIKTLDSSITSNIDGKGYVTNGSIFNFTGLAAGKYILKETKTPDGYNTLADATITISDDGTVSGINTSGEHSGMVQNLKGSLLPSTGGIGTTIFYLIGAILVIGAGVVFVTRRRMHSDK